MSAILYGAPMGEIDCSAFTITKPDEPKPVGPILDEASSAAIDLFTAGVERLDVTELARRLAVTLGAIERMKSR